MKKLVLAALIAALALAVASPAQASPTGKPAPAHIAKKCKKKHGKKKKCKKKHGKKRKCKKSVPAPVVTPPPPTPLALTSSEVINQVTLKAKQYCDVDIDCYDYGYYYTGSPGTPYCVSQTTYTWVCDGWNDEDNGVDPPAECEFREVVERDGYNGIKSHQDLSYGSGGWDCFDI
jgi:hypothetical protein